MSTLAAIRDLQIDLMYAGPSRFLFVTPKVHENIIDELEESGQLPRPQKRNRAAKIDYLFGMYVAVRPYGAMRGGCDVYITDRADA